ncbi:beta-defensin 15-like [Castor canadensis]|uniref:Beta-defensin n=1 Tax=Castor canadensis TaxID=51338 RepID=A0A8B7TU91_CASCN|nr:beta-defensin 15-like [Castor canadensis]
MKKLLFLFASLFFLAPAENAFFDDKCYKLKGRCVPSCRKNEEFVALCQKALKCCVIIQPCGKNEYNL